MREIILLKKDVNFFVMSLRERKKNPVRIQTSDLPITSRITVVVVVVVVVAFVFVLL